MAASRKYGGAFKNQTREDQSAFFPPNSDSDSLRKDRQWKLARDRLLAYLDVLEIPSAESLNICIDVLNRSLQEIESNGEGNPVAEAMRHLRRTIKSDSISSNFSTVPKFRGMPINPPVPELNRGRMTSEYTFQSFLSRIITFGKKTNSFPHGAQFLLIILCLIFIFFTVLEVFL